MRYSVVAEGGGEVLARARYKGKPEFENSLFLRDYLCCKHSSRLKVSSYIYRFCLQTHLVIYIKYAQPFCLLYLNDIA